MRVAIAGAGNVGQFIAADLLAAGHQVTMIEKDLHVLEVARPALKEAEWFPFDACEVLSLVMAGIAHADVMVAATGDDEDNLVISLLAKQEFAVPRVVARVNNPKNHGLFTEAWGVDVAVSTPHILRSLVEEAVTVGSMIKVMQFERGHVSLHAVTLADRSVAVGRTLRDLALPVDAAAVAVVREGHVVVPKEDTVFAAVSSGDNSNIVAARLAREKFEVPLVVARIYDPRRAEIYQRLGIPTVATVKWTTDQVMRVLIPDQVASDWRDPNAEIALITLILPDEWAGWKVEELEADGHPHRCAS